MVYFSVLLLRHFENIYIEKTGFVDQTQTESIAAKWTTCQQIDYLSSTRFGRVNYSMRIVTYCSNIMQQIV